MPSSLDGAMDRMDLNQDLEMKSYSTYFWRIGDGNVWETGTLVSFYIFLLSFLGKKRKSVISTSILQVG